jgi:methanogenic corrinoid protein MtbC1
VVLPPEVDAHGAAVGLILDAIERFDADALDEQLRRLFYIGPPSDTFERVIAPVLVTVGNRWHAGELSVAQEHFASQNLGGVLRALVSLSAGGEPTAAGIFACFAEEDHELGLLGVALRVAEWGIRPIFLGARTPPSAIRSALEALSPAFVGLSTTVAPARARARELVEEYAAACGSVPWFVGGAGAPSIADLVTKHGGQVAPAAIAELRAVIEPLAGDGRRRRGRPR